MNAVFSMGMGSVVVPRGDDQQQAMFGYIGLEQRGPQDQPLRRLLGRELVSMNCPRKPFLIDAPRKGQGELSIGL